MIIQFQKVTILLKWLILVIAFYPIISQSDSVAQKWNEQNLNAIRLDIPHPPVHARNLFHVSVAMWDAWAAFDDVAVGYLHNELAVVPDVKGDGVDSMDVEMARKEAISFAAYRVLRSRYQNSIGTDVTKDALINQMVTLGYDESNNSTEGDSPAALGNRIANTVLSFSWNDGSGEAENYVDLTYVPENDALPLDEPRFTLLTTSNPSRWQPLAFGDFALTQNGIETDLIQTFQGSQWFMVRPFALRRKSPGGLYDDPGPPPILGASGDQKFKDNINQVIRYSSWLDPRDQVEMNISPQVYANNSLGRMDGKGHGNNPVTGDPYQDNRVLRADYGRVIAEFWADGPESETPPGHWNVVANEVADHPKTTRRIEGRGPVVNDLEWDVKCYFAMNGAQHDAATAAWTCKRIYDYGRPISMCRYMGSMGQSTDKGSSGTFAELTYDPEGLKLEAGVVEIVTPETSLPGERHEHLSSSIGSIAIYAWSGEPEDPESDLGGVNWIPAMNWLPYQRDTFVTPAFASYVSGHSCFSRAGAEIMTKMTGSPYFPGGFKEYLIPKGSLEFEYGPTEDVKLQWASYYDASDEAGVSRLWGGIHVSVDDLPGRVMGSRVGLRAYELAKKYWDGSIIKEPVQFSFLRDAKLGKATINWDRTIGLFYKVQSSFDLADWWDETEWIRAEDIWGKFEDTKPSPERAFYRVLRAINGS
ncbi:MAG: vanadium-dependent haloperoxidase [Verrucomicrobiales bacterium]|nr:vanadium-dependent haloperoxidase [Verrucomicrobiales bacterium]